MHNRSQAALPQASRVRVQARAKGCGARMCVWGLFMYKVHCI